MRPQQLMADPIHNWSLSTATLSIAAELLATDPPTHLRADEISARLKQRSLRPTRVRLAGLHAGGLIDRVKLHTGRRGPPAWGYSLSDEQRNAARTAVAADGSSSGFLPTGGHLVRGQELIFVRLTGSRTLDVFELASSSRVIQNASWTAVIGNELVFAFDGQRPTPAAIDLMAVFAGARLKVRRAAVSHVAPIDELVAQARKTTPAARRARMTRDAYAERQ